MNPTKMIKCFIKYISDSQYRFLIKAHMGKYDDMPDEEYLKRKFYAVRGYQLNLEEPKTFNEKLQWLKLYNRNPEYTKMVDKYQVRDYIKEKIGEEYLIPLLGAWNDPDDIDFHELPQKFVLKCNHNSGLGMCICTDKSKLNIKETKKALKKGLEQNYYLTGREWPYKDVPRKIIAEKYMEDEESKIIGGIKDYKFYCFNGSVKFVMINSDRNTSLPTKADYFDKEFNALDFTWGYQHSIKKVEKPKQYDQMIQIAEKLSENIPHVRVDLYICDGKIYFGELTFFDGSGFDKIDPIDWDYKIGEYLELPER